MIVSLRAKVSFRIRSVEARLYGSLALVLLHEKMYASFLNECPPKMVKAITLKKIREDFGRFPYVFVLPSSSIANKFHTKHQMSITQWAESIPGIILELEAG